MNANQEKIEILDSYFDDEQILVSIEGKEFYLVLCDTQTFRDWIEDNYDMGGFMMKDVIYEGDGEYHVGMVVDWGSAWKNFYNDFYVNEYIRENNVDLSELKESV